VGEGSIDWLRLKNLRGVEVMDVRGVSRQWSHHHETYTICSASRVAENPDVPWRYRRREYVMRLGGTQLMEPGELHANVRCAPVADFGVVLIEPVRFLELLHLVRGYAGRRPALTKAQVFHPGIERKVHEVLGCVRSGDAAGGDDALLELVNALSEPGYL